MMKSLKFASLSLILVVAATAHAGNATVSASAGSVSGMSGSDPSTWTGFSGSASTAVIYYQSDPNKAATGDLSGATSELKCVDANGNLAPHTFNGMVSSSPGASSSVTGASTFSTPSGNAPQYYQASWTASSSSTGGIGASGTYDPWTVTGADLQAIKGSAIGGTTNLYYQTSLLGGDRTGFNLGSGQTGSYDFDVAVSQGGVRRDFLNFAVTKTGNGVATFTLNFSTAPNFALYYLDPTVAHNDGLSPSQRVTANGSMLLTATSAMSLFRGDLNPDGSLKTTLDFGLVYSNVVVPSDPKAVVIGYSTSTTQAVPEPAPTAALGLGALAFLRRRKR